MGLLFQLNRPVGKQATVPAKASSVPGIKQTAMRKLSVSANPRVPVPKSRVTSLSPTFAGRDCTLLRLIAHNPINVAFILVITAVLAVIPYLMRKPRRIWFMLLILPQQCLLLMHFVSAAIAIISGHYHDGYVPNGGSAFIFADQIWLLMVVVVHTFEYIEAL